MKLREDEQRWIDASLECGNCGHLEVFHNDHCCSFCMIEGCECFLGPWEIRSKGLGKERATPQTEEDRGSDGRR